MCQYYGEDGLLFSPNGTSPGTAKPHFCVRIPVQLNPVSIGVINKAAQTVPSAGLICPYASH